MGPTDATAPWWGAAYVASFGDAIRIADLRHAGLALGTSIAATVNAAILLVWTRRRLPGLSLFVLAKSAAVHVVAAVAMGAALVAYKAGMGGQGGGLLYVLGAIGSGAAVYFLTAWMLGSTEIRDLAGIATARLRG